MPGGIKSHRFLPESEVCSGYLMWKVHCSALESKAPDVAVVLGDVLGFVEITQAS